MVFSSKDHLSELETKGIYEVQCESEKSFIEQTGHK